MAEEQDFFADAIVWESPNGTPMAAASAVPDPAPVEAPGDDEAAPPEDEPGSEAEPVAPVAGEEPVAPEQPAGESRFSRRFSDLTHERDLARQEAQLLREQLDRERALQRPPVQESPPPPTAPDPFQRDQSGYPLMPQAAQFATQDAYEQAFQAWHVESTRLTTERAIHQAIMEDRQRQQADLALREVRQHHPDYDQVYQSRVFRTTPDVTQVIQGLGTDGHFVTYHLLTHPELEPQFAGLQGREAVKAVMRLAIELENQRTTPAPTGTPAPLPPRVSQAPPPITRTRATGSPPPVDLETADIMDFINTRNQQEQERRRRW